jgi:Cu(I)/Ag(I) efflux system membrane fusion protein
MKSKTSIAMTGVFVMAAAAGAAAIALRAGRVKPAGASSGMASHEHSAGEMHSAAGERHLWHCGMHPQVIQDHPGTCPICHMALTPFNDSAASSTSITIDPTVVQNMGVRTAIVTHGPLDVTIRAAGVLAVPQPGLHDVSLRIGGWIERLYANTEGMHVHQGDVLFDLYSPELQVAAEELISAMRARKPLGDRASDVVNADADRLVDSARRKLHLWGIADADVNAIANAEHPPRTVPYRSPASGDLVDNVVVQGSAVQAGMKLMRIEDYSHLWLDAAVYEDQLSLVAMGQTVEATIDARPGETFTGTISFIHPHVDPATRTLTTRITIDNAERKLRPGMYATVRIVSRAAADAVLVPREAVIDTGTRQIAFVAGAEGHFDARPVRTGLAGEGGQLQILEGLKPGESVVTSGQFLMDVESRTTEAIQKLRARP